MKYNNFVLIVLLVIFSCSSEKNNYPMETRLFKKYFKNEFPNEQIEFNENLQIIIIPAFGCKKCLFEAWELFEDNTYSNTLFISNYFEKEKDENIYQNKVLFENKDFENTLSKLIFVDIYPVLLHFNNEREISLIENLSPNNEDVFKSKIKK